MSLLISITVLLVVVVVGDSKVTLLLRTVSSSSRTGIHSCRYTLYNNDSDAGTVNEVVATTVVWSSVASLLLLPC